MELEMSEEEKKLAEAKTLLEEEKKAREAACLEEVKQALEKYGCALESFFMIKSK